MHSLVLRLAVIGVLATVAGVAWVANPGWVRRCGLDLWNLGAAEEWHRAEAARSRELDELKDNLATKYRATEAVFEDLLAGRATLGAAAADTLEINKGRPGFLLVLQIRYAKVARTDAECIARHLIERASTRLADVPHRQAEVLQRLLHDFALAYPDSPVPGC